MSNKLQINPIRIVHIKDHVQAYFWEDQKLEVFNYEPISEESWTSKELLWFDPTSYSDEELIYKIQTQLTFS